MAASRDRGRHLHHRADLLRRIHLPPEALPETRDAATSGACLRQWSGLACVGALVLCRASSGDRMKEYGSWWERSGSMLTRHPELIAAAREISGFGGGARWMHQAMILVGWRLPPFRGRGIYARMGWLKYGICILSGLSGLSLLVALGYPWLALWVAVAAFYFAEAQMVFLFPEALRGSRAPWSSARALTFSAGGTWRVMAEVLPIAARMLATGWWRGRGRETWLQGCLAVVIWHHHASMARRSWVEDASTLPRLEIGAVAPLLLRSEQVKMAGAGSFRVLWISDLHWRGAGDAGTLLALLDLARRARPDVCVLGGDFIEHARALPLLRVLVKGLRRIAPCVALPGNHDQGRFAESVPAAIRSAGGHWLPDSGRFELGNHLGGLLEIVTPGAPPPAANIRQIVAAHDPAELDLSPPDKGALVLAGHLHGGQWVFSSRNGQLLPASWFYPHAWLRRNHLGAEWIISCGAGDTCPVRWNCPREIVICEIL